MVLTNFPLPNREKPDGPYQDCLPCKVVGSTALTAGGLYLLVNKRLRDSTSDFYKDIKPRNVPFVFGTIKLAGLVCIAGAVLRAGDGIFWRKDTAHAATLTPGE
ncbi:hypothetical protein V1514DRAFT_328587 [Lipomyces japonicus]|uniref:uncharacterized protein n=1 Tax=Lipomyces japonicus TaxID=56871 RepID=UPI0034CF70F8